MEKNSDTDKWIGKKVYFPDQLKLLQDTIFYSIDIFEKEYINKNKVVSIVDVSCIKCILNQINKIDSTFNRILENDTNSVLVFVLNVHSSDSTYFMMNLWPMINTKGIILWDNNFNFEHENDLFTPELDQRTFMINSKNIIVCIGSPISNPNAIGKYQKELDIFLTEYN